MLLQLVFGGWLTGCFLEVCRFESLYLEEVGIILLDWGCRLPGVVLLDCGCHLPGISLLEKGRSIGVKLLDPGLPFAW